MSTSDMVRRWHTSKLWEGSSGASKAEPQLQAQAGVHQEEGHDGGAQVGVLHTMGTQGTVSAKVHNKSMEMITTMAVNDNHDDSKS